MAPPLGTSWYVNWPLRPTWAHSGLWGTNPITPLLANYPRAWFKVHCSPWNNSFWLDWALDQTLYWKRSWGFIRVMQLISCLIQYSLSSFLLDPSTENYYSLLLSCHGLEFHESHPAPTLVVLIDGVKQVDRETGKNKQHRFWKTFDLLSLSYTRMKEPTGSRAAKQRKECSLCVMNLFSLTIEFLPFYQVTSSLQNRWLSRKCWM